MKYLTDRLVSATSKLRHSFCSWFHSSVLCTCQFGYLPEPIRKLSRLRCRYITTVFGPIANLKSSYFQPSLSVCLSVCLWPALLPFNVDRFSWNLVTRTLLWSSLAATIMVPCVIHCALVTVQSTSGCYSMSVSSQLDSGLSTSQSPVWKHIRHGCTGVSVCQGIVGTARTGTTF